jgi:hypothetical protein
MKFSSPADEPGGGARGAGKGGESVGFTPRLARIAFILFVLTACATPSTPTADRASPLREQIWTEHSPTLAHDLTHGPSECLSPSPDAETRRAVEIGRALFRSPALLGGPAARTGLSCNACHTNGRVNAHFLLPELTNVAGEADTTSEWASKIRGDGIMNPRPIPDLAGVGAKATHGRLNDPSLEHFTHSVMTEEFQGPEPAPQAFAGVMAYLRALKLNACSPRETPETLESAASDVRRAFRAAQTGDAATARLVLYAAQDAVGRVVERLPAPRFSSERRELETLSRQLGAVRDQGGEVLPALNALSQGWMARFDSVIARLQSREAQTYFNEAQVRRLIAAH